MLLPDGVTKKVMHAGVGNVPEFTDDSKVEFHYRTLWIKDGKEQVMDDSKKNKQPFELLLGKKFKLEIWETLIKTMRVNEVASFLCAPQHVLSYPAVAKSLRDINKKNSCDHKHDHDEHHHTGHTCGFAAFSQGLGYPDLDEFLKQPTELTFQMELVKFTPSGEYKVDVWSLSLDEKFKLLPQWKEEGNDFFKKGDYENAGKMYSQAIGSLEQLMTREKPQTEEHIKLDHMKIPYLLNFTQCLLMKKDYYQAITHLTTILEKDENHVKALYRRGNAYQSIFDFNNARTDYEKVKKLDTSLIKTVDKELLKIDHEEKIKNLEDKKKFQNVFKQISA